MHRSFFFRLALPLALLCVSAGCAPSANHSDPATDAAALLAAGEKFPAAFNAHDLDAVTALYTDDAKLMPPGLATVSGRAAIHDHYAREIGQNAPPLSLVVEASGVSGDWGWRSGTWSANTSPAVTGKFVEIWRRGPDGWRIYRDIWNGDAAPPAAPPTAAG